LWPQEPRIDIIMNTIDVCISPDLLHLYNLEGKIVVVVDILRATSCMTTAFANGISSIIPVATVEECMYYKQQGYLAAAERDGKTAEGFDLGNSPFSYMDASFKGKTLVVTTTNGTLAITKSRSATQVLIGAFLNKTAMMNYLRYQNRDVLVLCSGWRGTFNMEDTLYAGALVSGLEGILLHESDSSLMAKRLYESARYDMMKYMEDSTHFKRLSRLNAYNDIEFCMTEDLYTNIAGMSGNELVVLA
jgi:2-phosphosulfolactate phosphatase